MVDLAKEKNKDKERQSLSSDVYDIYNRQASICDDDRESKFPRGFKGREVQLFIDH